MSAMVTSIDQVKDARGNDVISVSYIRDNHPVCLTCTRTTRATEAIVAFVSGHITDDELVTRLAGADEDALEARLAPIFARFAPDLSVENDHVRTKDGPEIDAPLEEKLVRLMEDGADDDVIGAWAALVQRLHESCPLRVRQPVARWLLADESVSATPDGMIAGWLPCHMEDGSAILSMGGATIRNDVLVTHRVSVDAGDVLGVPEVTTAKAGEPSIRPARLAILGRTSAEIWAKGDLAPALAHVCCHPADVVTPPTGKSTTRLDCKWLRVLGIEELDRG